MRIDRVLPGLLALGLSLVAPSPSSAASPDASGPTVIRSRHVVLSRPARDVRSVSPRLDGPAPPSPGAGAGPAGRPFPSLTFDGAANACSCSPPDPNGDVGRRNYVQIVNRTLVSVYSKAGGLQSRFDLGSLWTSGPCTSDDGDPNVVYDALADRWVLAQLSGAHGGKPALCFAVSRTSDPAGSYFLYEFDTPSVPDYFKVGVWPNGYYVSSIESTDTAYALNRAKMLAGDSAAEAVRFAGEVNFLLPASLAGSNAPAPQGGLFYTFKDGAVYGGPDRIELFRLTPDFASPGSSTFTRIGSFDVAPFTSTVCGSFVCIPQGGTTQKLDALEGWPMYRFAYRRFADHEALVGNFTVGGGSGGAGAAIRWFELRNRGSGWTLFQQGTQDYPGVDQWMGSVNIDRAGDIALGYSESGPAAFPSIRFAARTPRDPLGTLEPERVLQAGGGSQTGTHRWGDYSSMAVDPVDGCDFWYTQEYYRASSGSGWRTAIGRFSMPACSPAPHTTLGGHPPRRTRSRAARFNFRSDAPGATFRCKLDRRPYEPCRSPKRYRRLEVGRHRFKVAAVRAGKADRSPAVFRWRVVRGRR